MTSLVTLVAITASDRDDFVNFITAQQYPFHVNTSVSAEDAASWFDDGELFDDDHRAFWIVADADRIGLAVLEDLSDDGPLFDLRLADTYRGQGFGTAALVALTDLVFSTMTSVERFEGNTRVDNLAMRATFRRAGWSKEAHHRDAWPEGDNRLDAVGYAILRREWETGTTASVNWADE